MENSLRNNKFSKKNPINEGSKDPLKPPSASQDYCLFTGFPIRDLEGPDSTQSKHALIKQALKLPQIPHIPCGSHNAKINWKRLHKLEQQALRLGISNNFAIALAILKTNHPKAPPLHTNLALESWLLRLQKLGSKEAADGYWGLSRGFEVIPEHIKREPTKTPNYVKHEHQSLLQEEIKRILQDGYIASYDELQKIWNLPDIPTDTIALGFIVKKRSDGTLKVILLTPFTLK